MGNAKDTARDTLRFGIGYEDQLLEFACTCTCMSLNCSMTNTETTLIKNSDLQGLCEGAS